MTELERYGNDVPDTKGRGVSLLQVKQTCFPAKLSECLFLAQCVTTRKC